MPKNTTHTRKEGVTPNVLLKSFCVSGRRPEKRIQNDGDFAAIQDRLSEYSETINEKVMAFQRATRRSLARQR